MRMISLAWSLIAIVIALQLPTAFTRANMMPDDANVFFIGNVIVLFFGVPVLINLLIEAAAGLAYVRLTKKPTQMLLSQAIANIVTFIPFVTIFMVNDELNAPIAITIAEIIIVTIEACILRLAHRRTLTWKDAFTLSAIANGASIVFGVILSDFYLSFSR